jgi:hypothetical protein
MPLHQTNTILLSRIATRTENYTAASNQNVSFKACMITKSNAVRMQASKRNTMEKIKPKHAQTLNTS